MRFARHLQPALARHLARGKSILLLGPRQTGKTTLLGELDADLTVSLASPAVIIPITSFGRKSVFERAVATEAPSLILWADSSIFSSTIRFPS